MISFPKRVVVSITATSLLHASIFYSLYGASPKEDNINKPIEIALLDDIKTKEQPKAELEKPKQEQPPQKPKPKEAKKEPQLLTKAKPLAILEDPVKDEMPKERVAQAQEIQESIQTSSSSDTKESITSSQSKEVVASKIDPSEIEKYLYKVRLKIQTNLKYPALAKRLRLEGESMVEFEILDNGGVMESSCKIKHSSGHKTLDQEAMETILSISPLEAPPNGKISIIVPVIFNLK